MQYNLDNSEFTLLVCIYRQRVLGWNVSCTQFLKKVAIFVKKVTKWWRYEGKIEVFHFMFLKLTPLSISSLTITEFILYKVIMKKNK